MFEVAPETARDVFGVSKLAEKGEGRFREFLRSEGGIPADRASGASSARRGRA